MLFSSAKCSTRLNFVLRHCALMKATFVEGLVGLPVARLIECCSELVASGRPNGLSGFTEAFLCTLIFTVFTLRFPIRTDLVFAWWFTWFGLRASLGIKNASLSRFLAKLYPA